MTTVQELTFANGRKARITRIEGEVLHADRQHSLHVTSRGGGGMVGPHGGYVAAPTVTSQTTEHETIFLRLADGSETSLWFRNWSVPVRPGSRLAVILAAPGTSSEEAILAARNMDTGEERWTDVRDWAQGHGLLGGKMRVWPSALIAALGAGAFVNLRAFALAKQGVQVDLLSDWLLAAGIVFIPTVIVEWVIAIAVRATDGEAARIAEQLTVSLRGAARQ